MGEEGCRSWPCESDVCRWLLPGGGNRDASEHVRVSFLSIHPLSPCRDNTLCRAISYYKRAADLGDKRATQRLRGNNPMHQPGGPGSLLHRDMGSDGNGKTKDKDCVIM